MNTEKIKWCLGRKRGIELTEPKPHLSRSYMDEADETLENVFSSKGKWRTITAYYACYSALYSILMRCGIKSEIHECTLELMCIFEFTESEKRYMAGLKEDRVQAQYYLKKIVLKDEESVKNFVLKCKTILSGMNSRKIKEARKWLKEKKPKGPPLRGRAEH
ncbi:MAG: hypothetical protein R6U32_06485 [Candidatus Woesearchaeota archaeon]